MNEQYKFNIKEIKALYRILEHQWIDREDEEAQIVASKISRIIKFHTDKNERLADRDSQSA